jgi:transmembrane sensor
MQNIYEKYIQYDVTGFVMDDDFIEWVRRPDVKKNEFWNGFIANYPQQAKNIEEAKKLIFSFDTPLEKAPEEVKNRIWASIKKESVSGRLKVMNSRRIWLVAASILLIVFAAGSFYLANQTSEKETAKAEVGKSKVENDVPPGGNKAVLTLANGATIILDSAKNGALTQLGNIKIMKLEDGQLAYQVIHAEAQKAVQYNTISTPPGGQYQVMLADGSKVWLNAASSITFPTAFTGDSRKVEITGEAYCEIAHNAQMPFSIKVNNVTVQVLGTRFNVNAYDDEDRVSTTLLEGSVKVSNAMESKVISPGDQASVNNNSGSIMVKKKVDVDQVIAWKNGYFQFNDAAIQDIMRQISRWYNVKIIYKGSIPSGHYVGKPSRNLNLSQILKVIEYSGIKLEIKGDTVIVSE